MLCEASGDTSISGYRFGLQPRDLADYLDMCHFHQTSPMSHFTQRRICSLATPTGRITLSDMTLIITDLGDRHEWQLTKEEWKRALQGRFGLDAAGVMCA